MDFAHPEETAMAGIRAFSQFLSGLGMPKNVPSLGNLVEEGRKMMMTSSSYQLIFPALVVTFITVSFYLVGNAFADAADPRNHV